MVLQLKKFERREIFLRFFAICPLIFKEVDNFDLLSALNHRLLPKFYLFDVGLANYLAQCQINILKSAETGQALEHFILIKLRAFLGFNELDMLTNFYRSKSVLKVGFILNYGDIAIEVKISENISVCDLNVLSTFCDDCSPSNTTVVSRTPRKRKVYLQNQWCIKIKSSCACKEGCKC